MSKSEPLYERIIRYLKDLLSNRERHDLEKEVMHDAFDEEAFEGLTGLSAGDLESDMDKLTNRLDARVENSKKRSLVFYYRIAASVIVLMGIGTILYFVLRTPQQTLITQETKPVNKTTVVPNVPAGTKEAPETEAMKSEESQSHAQEKPGTKSEKPLEIQAEISDQVVATTEVEQPILEEAKDVATVPAESATRSEVYNALMQEPGKEKKSDKTRIRGVASIPPSENTLSAKVVDDQGQPLPGVSILIKGTNKGTVTDADGNFSLQVPDANPVLALNYIGFKPLEIKGKDVNGKDITMTEDLVALNEVVVVGYGTQKKQEVTGAVSRIDGKTISGNDEAAAPGTTYSNPVPPGGSVRAFKQWVNSQVDPSLIKSFTGRYRFQVTLTVHADGTTGDISIKDNIPEAIANEYKRVVAASKGWKPALENDSAVEAKIVIRFVITFPIK